MKWGVAIQNPYDDKIEAVVGPFDSEDAAESYRQVIQQSAYGDVIMDVDIHPDCIGTVIPIGSIHELADSGVQISGLTEPGEK